MSTQADAVETPKDSGLQRRGLLAGFVAATAAITAFLIPLISGAIVFFDPVLKKRDSLKGSREGFLPSVRLEDLPANGDPLLVTLVGDRVDAWNVFARQPVGKVYLRRIEQNVIAFNNICPHLGCKVIYEETTSQYLCPCHGARFKQDGDRENTISPRKMDALETQVDDNGLVWVKYENFRRGTSERTPV